MYDLTNKRQGKYQPKLIKVFPLSYIHVYSTSISLFVWLILFFSRSHDVWSDGCIIPLPNLYHSRGVANLCWIYHDCFWGKSLQKLDSIIIYYIFYPKSISFHAYVKLLSQVPRDKNFCGITWLPLNFPLIYCLVVLLSIKQLYINR